MNLLIILLTILIGLSFIFHGTPIMDKFLNRYVDIKNIVKTPPRHFGDLLTNQDHFMVKFMWTTKQISFNHVDKVKAYSTVDHGLENHFKFLEMHTKDKNVLSFNPNQPSHCNMVSDFISQQCNKTINLNIEDYPPDGANQNGDIPCGRN